ncbi:peptidoglycan DD-metalloendopeptidase family protein [Domibacillus sp.]|uniref:murein hydrolase activator EnvC family protein n=1 Tax=Domibacillus sp. TaxID=1969783 RepID=UPI00281108F5|nr:peptidoglycan DD-metalloendopeptidase family protein [Domibacillus sp.]
MKRKSYVALAVAASIGFSFTGGASAESLSDLQKRQQQIQSQKSGLEQNINKKEEAISNLQQQQDSINAEIRKLDGAITDSESKIRAKEQEIADTKAEIERLRAEIEELKIRIAERTKVLEDRARSIQQSGGSASYMEVLLGAESFSDFVSRATAVTALVNADKEILQEQERDKKQLEANEQKVKEELASLENMLADLQTMKAKLEKQREAKNEVMKGLVADEHEAHEQKLSLEEEQSLLSAQEASIQAAIKAEQDRIAEQKRLAEEAAKKKAEQEAAAAAAAKAAASKAAASASSSAPAAQEQPSAPAAEPKQEVRSAATPADAGGMFMRPAEGTFTSGYGIRSLGDHKGIDIANSESVPIVAAADGVVSRSYYSDSYGNAIFISHSINGQIYTTVYAHLSERVVQGGSVSKGQVIGYMGNTGRSYGQHLHFEIHKGPWTLGKENAVDPAQYINL